ncbi:hypothetical protein CEXT_415411 [Caerostris extrusa]|uniref:Secreted protein n=1 Tax=Caerostris extrusa TaxID=172846 RepID=A0AAV4US43_CAEEX|nr:hypothetical protein CEXT_415411 [Caerostris extrusa]
MEMEVLWFGQTSCCLWAQISMFLSQVLIPGFHPGGPGFDSRCSQGNPVSPTERIPGIEKCFHRFFRSVVVGSDYLPRTNRQKTKLVSMVTLSSRGTKMA